MVRPCKSCCKKHHNNKAIFYTLYMKKRSTTILMLIMLFVLIVTLHNVLHAQNEKPESQVTTDDMEIREHSSTTFLSGVLMRMAQ